LTIFVIEKIECSSGNLSSL